MGRKKRIKKVEAKAEDQINYSGKVTVSKVFKGKIISSKTIHNSGNTPLFEFILNCLSGIYDPKLRPAYAVCTNKLNNNIVYATNKAQTIASVKKITTDGRLSVEYTFYFPYTSAFKDTGITGIATYCLNNLPNSIQQNKTIDSDYSMFVDLGADPITVNREEDLLVVWRVSIENKQGE